jgi:outer membrane protein TolC
MERRTASSGWYTPDVTAATEFTTFSDPFFNFGTGDISSNATSATLEARYTVLGGGKLSLRKRAFASEASAAANDIAARFQVALTADAAFYAVIADQEFLRVATDRLARAEEQLGVARVRVQAGDALGTDSLQLLLEVNRARIDRMRRDSALVVSRLQLGRLVGEPGPVDAAPLAATAPPALPISLAIATADLLRTGPSIAATRAEESRTLAELSSQREGYLPEVSLSAVTGAYDSRFFPSALNRSQLSLRVSLPIWNGGQRELQITRARAQLDVASAVTADQERAAAEQMTRVYLGYESAVAEIQLATQAGEVARESFRIHSTRYREGAGGILDVLRAQDDVGETESDLVRARYSARLALARIEALLGRRLFN